MSGSVTISKLNGGEALPFSTPDAVAFAQQLATVISNGLNNNTLQSVNYTGGNVAPVPSPFLPTNGVVSVNVPTTNNAGQPGATFVNGADNFIVVNSPTGGVQLQGGAAGGTLVGGAGPATGLNISYTNITATGAATDSISILGGNNYISTNADGQTSHFQISTGSGNDSINILEPGSATINPGTGSNVVNVGTGSNLIFSEGFDTITGPGSNAGGSDTVNIGSGQTSINSGGANFQINDSSPHRATVTLGSGVDTVNVAAGSSASVSGLQIAGTYNGAGTLVATDATTGDGVTITGSGSGTFTAAGRSDTINASGSNGSSLLQAGTGNDTLIAGQGNDTLTGAKGANATALLVSGGTAPTTFSFTFGQSGGSDTISGFKATDQLVLNGTSAGSYGSAPLGTGVSVAGGTTYNLNDGTTLTILGTQPTAGNVHSS